MSFSSIAIVTAGRALFGSLCARGLIGEFENASDCVIVMTRTSFELPGGHEDKYC